MKLKLQLAVACLGIGLAVLFVAVKFESSGYFVTSELARQVTPPYTRMWFQDEEMLAGVRLDKSGRLHADQWNAGGSIAAAREIRLTELSGPDLWAVSQDLHRAAWIAGPVLRVQALEGAPAIALPLPAERGILALGFPSRQSVSVVFDDGEVRRWSLAEGEPLTSWKAPLPNVKSATQNGDYLALASEQAKEIHLYRFQEAAGWGLTERSPLPEGPHRLTIPAAGILVAYTQAGVRLGGETRNTPGTVSSAVPELYDLLITGDFPNVVALPAERERYEVAAAPPGSLLAGSAKRLALSSEQGTILYQLSTEERMSRMGRNHSFLSIGLLVLAAVLACMAFIAEGSLANLLMALFGRRRGIRVRSALQEPPAELLSALLEGRAVLWAGAGLGAQAGFPLRATFIANILQTAGLDGWLPAERAAKLAGQAARGEPEKALNLGVKESVSNRGAWLAELRAIYARMALPSPCHRKLAELPFHAAITTNYDLLLDRAEAPWAANRVTLASEHPAELADVAFLLKLYGDLDAPSQVLLSREEFMAALPKTSMRAVIERVFATRSLLFVGCSLPGLLEDCAALGLKKSETRHFALCGVANANWTKQAAELKARFGVEVLECAEEAIAAALPVFLDQLSEQIGKREAAPEPQLTA